MKAAIVRSAGVLEVSEVPRPKPGPYQALCEILWGSVCTGTDSHIVDGTFPFISPYPTILGHESVGRVVELGKGVNSYRVGDLVTRVGAPAVPEMGISITWGGFAEYGLAWDHWAMARDGVPRETWSNYRVNRVLHPLVKPADAPMFTTWRETLSFIRRMGLTTGGKVAIIGSGGNGLSFAVHARNLGASRIVMAGAGPAESAARRVGVTDYLDYRASGAADRLASLCGRSMDFVIDAVGKKDTGSLGLSLLRDGGALAVYGMDDFGALSLNLSNVSGSFRYYNGGYDEAETHESVTDHYLGGRLDASVWLGAAGPFGLPEIGKAFDAVRSRRSPKALVRILG